MRGYLESAALLALLFWGSSTSPAIHAARVSELLDAGFQTSDVSPVFLSDNLIALVAEPKTKTQSATAELVVLEWDGHILRRLANGLIGIDQLSWGGGLEAVAEQRFVTLGLRHKRLFSSDLKSAWDLPNLQLCRFFPRGGVIGCRNEKEEWRTFSIGPTLKPLSEGSGSLEAVSSETVVYQSHDRIYVEGLDHRLLGSIPMSTALKNYSHTVDAAGPNHLYLNVLEGDDRVVDLSGKGAVALHAPDGWGTRHGWNSDGSRMLFDHFTRSVPFADWPGDLLLRLLGVPENSNGETVKVLDTKTGDTCFALDSPNRLFGKAGGYHADLSPSGLSVVVATQEDLSIYRLPAKCSSE